jgi:glyoxylase-like metal-dependent hydrolase (beta-lactamase superfamily II)
MFTAATLYIQKAEYDAAFGPEPAKYGFAPETYDRLRANRMVRLEGDFDVFGDGSVKILSTPGHTPGHQSLLVRLPKTGAVVLSGDAAHFQENFMLRRVPGFNYGNVEQSRQSMIARQRSGSRPSARSCGSTTTRSRTRPLAPRAAVHRVGRSAAP